MAIAHGSDQHKTLRSNLDICNLSLAVPKLYFSANFFPEKSVYGYPNCSRIAFPYTPPFCVSRHPPNLTTPVAKH
jgi:hypothetical protein